MRYREELTFDRIPQVGIGRNCWIFHLQDDRGFAVQFTISQLEYPYRSMTISMYHRI